MCAQGRGGDPAPEAAVEPGTDTFDGDTADCGQAEQATVPSSLVNPRPEPGERMIEEGLDQAQSQVGMDDDTSEEGS